MYPTRGYDLGPIIGIQIYKRDVVVRRRGQRHPNAAKPTAERGKITMLSKKSRKRLAFIVTNTRVTLSTMITLTYPKEFPTNGMIVKRDLDAFLLWQRRFFRKPSYVWFLEFQKRGAPHIHILLDYPLPQNPDERIEMFHTIARRWYEIVGSGDEKHRQAGTRCETIRKKDGASRYALKYAYKCEQKTVPLAYQNVGRFWGCSRDVPPKTPRVIPMDEGSVRAILMDWDYCPDSTTLVYQTLFGCAERFKQYSGIRTWIALQDDIPKCQSEIFA